MSNQDLAIVEFDRVDDDGGPEVYAVLNDSLYIIPRSQVYQVITGDGGSVEFSKWKAVELGLV